MTVKDVAFKNGVRALAPPVRHLSIDIEYVVVEVSPLSVAAAPFGEQQQRQTLLRPDINHIIVYGGVSGAAAPGAADGFFERNSTGIPHAGCDSDHAY